MLQTAIIEINLHGQRLEDAKRTVRHAVHVAGPSTYRIRIIHGYHGGTAIKEMILDEFGYGREPKVQRIMGGSNPGITELILREYC